VTILQILYFGGFKGLRLRFSARLGDIGFTQSWKKLFTFKPVQNKENPDNAYPVDMKTRVPYSFVKVKYKAQVLRSDIGSYKSMLQDGSDFSPDGILHSNP
jgi:hypothetical protein